MLEPVLQGVEAVAVEPVAVPGDLRQCAPFVVSEGGNGDPAVLALTAISAVRRCRSVWRTVAVAEELALIGRPVEDRGASQENTRLALRGVDPLALASALAVIDRAEQCQRIAIGAHPVEVGIAPADRHRRLRHARHLALAAKRRRYRADRAHPSVSAVRTHTRLLDVDDIGPDRLHHVVAEPQALQYAGRETLRDHIANAHHVLGDL